jgi:hypothetical protein
MSQWYNGSWLNRQAVTIHHEQVPSTLSNFVCYLDETGFVKPGLDSDIFEGAKADGSDIVVTASDGFTKLDHELVAFDAGNQKLELWVKIPTVAAGTDTTIFVYYGNAAYTETYTGAVWTSYQYVSHNGGKTDSTGNAAASTTYGSPTLLDDGITGKAYDFENAGDIFDTGLGAITYPLTFQTWVKPSSFTGPYVMGNYNSSSEDLTLYTQSSQWVFNVENGGGAHGFGTVNQGAWNFLGVTIDSQYNKTYHNGSFIGTISSAGATGSIDTGNTLHINDRGDTVNTAGGIAIDEIRFYAGVLDADHIEAEYNNQVSPATFYSVSNQQEVSGAYVAPPTADITLTDYVPLISVGVNIVAPAAALSFVTQAPVVGTGVVVSLGFGTITLDAPVAGVDANVNIPSAINVDIGKHWGGARKFKPVKPFELFKEGNLKNKDSQFISGINRQIIEFGGVVCYIWKLLGTYDQSSANGKPGTQLDEAWGELDDDGNLIGIQDTILGENRDRKYSENSIRLKGTYAVSENELDYARFGMALLGDIIQIEFHKEDMVEKVGRRLKPGDVIEMVHLREIGEDGTIANRYYEVDNIARSPSGYDHTYQYHILAATLKPIRDSQEFIDLMEREDEYGRTLQDQISNRKYLEGLTAKNQDAANEQAYTTNYDTTPLYITDEGQIVPHIWTDDGEPPNGRPVTQVTSFPSTPTEGDYVVRIDFFPNKLYRYQSGKWLLKEKDTKREWQPYNWTRKLREFSSDRTIHDDIRPWELKSIHDIGTPTQGRSNPSPKGHDIIHANIFDWDRKIKVEIPDDVLEEAPEVERSATLIPTNAQTNISDFLNATSGQYDFFLVYYVITRGNNQQTGELLLNDDGTNVSIDQEKSDIGDVGVTFYGVHEGGYRKLKYTMTDGSNATIKFFVKGAW